MAYLHTLPPTPPIAYILQMYNSLAKKQGRFNNRINY